MPDRDPKIVIDELWKDAALNADSQVYVILDAARDESVYSAVMDYPGEYCCLYGAQIPEVLAKTAPYLIKLQQQDSFTDWLINEGWGNGWGVFLEASAAMEELGQHLLQYLKVQTEEGNELFFRYYDPRVLRVYLPTCTEEEADLFFGPVQSFIMEAKDPGTVFRCSRGHQDWFFEDVDL